MGLFLLSALLFYGASFLLTKVRDKSAQGGVPPERLMPKIPLGVLEAGGVFSSAAGVVLLLLDVWT
jgi:hypothetical protein